MAHKRSKSRKKTNKLAIDQVKKTKETSKIEPKRRKSHKKKYHLTIEQRMQIQERIQRIIDTNAEVVSYDRYKKKEAAVNTENDTEMRKTVNDAAHTAAYPIAIQKATDQVDAGSCTSPKASLETGAVQMETNAVDKVVNSSACTTNLHTTGNKTVSNNCDLIKSVNYAATKNFVQIPCNNVSSVNTADCAAVSTDSATPVIQRANNNSSSNYQKNMHLTNASLPKPTAQYNTLNAAVLNSSNISAIPLVGATKSVTDGHCMPQPVQSDQLVPILIDGKLYYLSPGFGKNVAEIKISKPVGKESTANKNIVQKETTANKDPDQSRFKTIKQICKEIIDGQSFVGIKKKPSAVDDANKLASENVSSRKESSFFENINMNTGVFSFQGTEIKKETLEDKQTLHQKPHGQEFPRVSNKTSSCTTSNTNRKELKWEENEEEENDEEENDEKENEEEEIETEEESTDGESEEDIDYECLCGKFFYDLVKYEKHTATCTNKDSDFELSGSTSESDVPDHNCNNCGQTFRNSAALKKHEPVCACISDYHDDEDESSVEKTKNRFTEMSKKFRYTVSWINSKGKIVYAEKVVFKKKKSCAECNESLFGETMYECHMLMHENDKAGISFECQICQESFSIEMKLQAHENKAHGAKHKPFQCKHCNRKFRSAHGTDTHMSVHGSGQYPYQCNDCSKGFTKREYLVEHMEVHSNETLGKTIPCEECERTFLSESILNKHIRRIHKKYPCETCGKLFSSYRLKVHIESHAEVKRFECSVCKKRFAQRSNRNSHMRVHTGKKPYDCDICSKSFNHKVSLKTHKRSAHGIDWWADNGVKKTKEILKGKPLWKPLRK